MKPTINKFIHTIIPIRFRRLIVFAIIIVIVSCGKQGMPLPYGYFRVDLPEHAYTPVSDTLGLPYKFEFAEMANVQKIADAKEKYSIDINYPELNAGIFCSYFPVNGNLYQLLEDAHKYVYKHSVKADGIGRQVFQNPEKHVYGILYDIKGNTASSVQFVLTDSVRHFFRGALYFNNVPNKDSIAPMSDYVKQDIEHLMESFEWQ
jgi:gliding motility-associated lipoprotein GldD